MARVGGLCINSFGVVFFGVCVFVCGLRHLWVLLLPININPSKAIKQSVASGTGKNHDKKLNRRVGMERLLKI
jgi:hypothetical protein